MSVVAPNGQVRLLSGVPIDDTYENTLYFANQTAQTTYFLGLTPVHTMANATRVREGVIAVNALADNLLTCNYLMFQNQAFSTKWFYAFVEDVIYVNNNMTHIRYRIDEIQTWLYDSDVTLLACMIERQHSETDGIYDNLIPEDIGAPELTKVTNLDTEGLDNAFSAVLFTSLEETGGDWGTSELHCINGLLGCHYPTVTAENYIGNDGDVRSASWTVFNAVVQDIIANNKADGIIGGVIMPTAFMRARIEDGDTGAIYDGTAKSIAKSGLSGSLDGYTPKNNKMYNAPYVTLRYRMSDGQCLYLEPQYIDGNYITWHEVCVTSMQPELAVIPKNYKGQTFDFENYLSFTKFPQFSIAVDGYKAWVASGGLATAELKLQQVGESASLEKSIAGTKGFMGTMKGASKATIGGMKAYYSGGMTGGEEVSEGLSEMGDAILEAEFTKARIEQGVKFANENFDLQHAIAKTLPPSLKGNSIGNALATARRIGYTVDKMTINAQQAESIDSYFTMFGYKQNKIGVPNLNARPHFTYIKTMDCKVNGGAPSSSLTAIQKIFNAGIRFWKNASEVGDYTVNNAPV